VLVVRLNQRGKFDLAKIVIPPMPWKEVWFFWAASSDLTRWALYGDALGDPGQWEFDYPA
jgi:hypothetical protein